jgi:hypothetical protein
LLGKDHSRLLDRSANRTVVVLGRSLSKHETFAFPAALSAAQRKKALALAIRRWAPYQAAASSVYWTGDTAVVYAWDDARVTAVITEAGFDPTRVKVVPETFHRAPGVDGLRLATAIDGFEGQAWRGGAPTATRWWPRQPSEAEWLAFCRSARGGAAAPATCPAAEQVPFSETAWTRSFDIADEAWTLLDEPRHRVAFAAAAASIPLYLGAQWLSLSLAGAELKAEIDRLYRDSEPVRVERDATLANLDAIDLLLGLERPPPQFMVLHRTFQLLNGFDVKIIDWTFDTGALELSLESATDIEATRFIEAFERDDLFANVSARTLNQPRVLRLKMDVSDPREKA